MHSSTVTPKEHLGVDTVIHHFCSTNQDKNVTLNVMLTALSVRPIRLLNWKFSELAVNSFVAFKADPNIWSAPKDYCSIPCLTPAIINIWSNVLMKLIHLSMAVQQLTIPKIVFTFGIPNIVMCKCAFCHVE